MIVEQEEILQALNLYYHVAVRDHNVDAYAHVIEIKQRRYDKRFELKLQGKKIDKKT